jgi:hypothetical protein
MAVRKPEPEVAFRAAALVLIGAPVLMLAGLIAFVLAARVLTPIDQLLRGPLVLPLVLAWGVLVVAIVLILGVRMSRRMTRP